MAEGVFRHLAAEAGITGEASIAGESGVLIDSAGTIGYHVGDPPDPRGVQTASAHGVDLSAQRARRVADSDFETFDYILAMDEQNLSELMQRCPSALQSRLGLFMDHAPQLNLSEVPDPYYGGQEGFEHCYELVREAAEGLLEKIIADHFPDRT